MKMNSRKNDNVMLKIQFYLISLIVLFALVILITVDFPSCKDTTLMTWFKRLITNNILSDVLFVLILIGFVSLERIKYNWKGVTWPACTITKIKNENYEYLAFLMTYIIPLACIDFENVRYVIVFFIVLLLIGFIFIKGDLYYGNPTLAIFGYHLYRVSVAELDYEEDLILISKDKLTLNDNIEWIEIGEYVWVAKKCKKK